MDAVREASETQKNKFRGTFFDRMVKEDFPKEVTSALLKENKSQPTEGAFQTVGQHIGGPSNRDLREQIHSRRSKFNLWLK